MAWRILLMQAGWTIALVLLGSFMWHRNQRHLVVQGG